MPRHHNRNGVQVPYTAQEETDRDAEEAAYASAKPMNDWVNSMNASDQVLPRWAEDIMDNMDMSSVPQQTKDKLASKKALRLTRPGV